LADSERPLHVRYLPTTGSTNDEALRLPPDDDHQLVWTTDQRGGRGSRGRSWVSPKGVGLALTLGLRCGPWPHPATFCYPLAAGLWLHEALTRVMPRAEFHLKWPNDLLLDGRKLAGILCESRMVGSEATVAIGIGINLRDDPALHQLGRPYATLAELPFPSSAQAVIDALAAGFRPLLRNLGDGSLRARWLQRCGIPPGSMLRVTQDGRRFDGRFEGLSSEGGLCLRLGDGSLKVISQAVEDCMIVPVSGDTSHESR